MNERPPAAPQVSKSQVYQTVCLWESVGFIIFNVNNIFDEVLRFSLAASRSVGVTVRCGFLTSAH